MAFLQYMHSQIGHLSTGLSLKMDTRVLFRNVSEKQNDPLPRPAPTIKRISDVKNIYHCLVYCQGN